MALKPPALKGEQKPGEGEVQPWQLPIGWAYTIVCHHRGGMCVRGRARVHSQKNTTHRLRIGLRGEHSAVPAHGRAYRVLLIVGVGIALVSPARHHHAPLDSHTFELGGPVVQRVCLHLEEPADLFTFSKAPRRPIIQSGCAGDWQDMAAAKAAVHLISAVCCTICAPEE